MADYFKRWATLTLLLLMLVGGLAWYVDPYGLYRPYDDDNRKPHAASLGQLVKPYRVVDLAPRTLILGNSRAEVGFDPLDSAWPKAARPVYNLALPGTGTRVWRRLFEHATWERSPDVLLLGLDFADFLLAPDTVAREPDLSARLRVDPDGHESSRVPALLADAGQTLLSLDALAHSLDTLSQRDVLNAAHLSMQGFNPMYEYPRLARREGYFALFRQRDVENLKQYRKRPANLFRTGTRTSVAFDDLEAVLRLARTRGVKVHLVIYPYHGHLLETLQTTNLWPLFEDWKRALTSRADANADVATLWDFSGYHAYAVEAVPTAADRHTVVQHYWEAGHFKSALGKKMLMRMFGGTRDFGVPLNQAMLDSHLAALRAAGVRYRQTRASELTWLH